MRVNKLRQNFHFWVNYPFKHFCEKRKINITSSENKNTILFYINLLSKMTSLAHVNMNIKEY